jgi:hypothetical protein
MPSGAAEGAATTASGLPAPPLTMPDGWDALAYNRQRGNAGAIPASYLDDINGPDGDEMHLGKHLPYIPVIEADALPEGFLALMWGDAERGFARHPNAVRNESNSFEGHWYNWIRVRKVGADSSMELESSYSEWPGISPDDNGAYAVYGGGDIAEDAGKNTIYLAALPPGVGSGDTIRIWAHCLTHGEYVDFITLA